MKKIVLLSTDRYLQTTGCIHSDMGFLEKTRNETTVLMTILMQYTEERTKEVVDIIGKCPISKMLGNATAQFPWNVNRAR